MTSKVEELREQLFINISDYKACLTKGELDRLIVTTLDLLISAARAEGAEEIKKSILRYCDTHPFMRPQEILAAAVLAPPNETVAERQERILKDPRDYKMGP